MSNKIMCYNIYIIYTPEPSTAHNSLYVFEIAVETVTTFI